MEIFCNSCGALKDENLFNFCKARPTGRQAKCQDCEKQYKARNRAKIAERNRIYRQINKNKISEKTKQYNAIPEVRAKRLERCQNYRNAHSKEEQNYKKTYYIINKAKLLKKTKDWRKNNPEKHKKYMREYMFKKRKKDINFALRAVLHQRLYSALKSQNIQKTNKTIDLVGCSIKELKQHIESLFAPGMSWEGYFAGNIHIDHILPCCSFNLEDLIERRKCFHYSNLRPLWKADNLKKSHLDRQKSINGLGAGG